MGSSLPHFAGVWSKCRWGFFRRGVGVAGWLLGGRYLPLPPKANQFELRTDNVVGYQVVLLADRSRTPDLVTKYCRLVPGP
jgi:hypothetical protein